MERRRSAHGRAMLGNRATHNHSMGNYMNALDEIARGMHDEPQWKRAALALAESSVFDAILVVLVGVYGVLASGSLLFDSEIREDERIHFWFTVITIVINVVFLCEVMIKCAAYGRKYIFGGIHVLAAFVVIGCTALSFVDMFHTVTPLTRGVLRAVRLLVLFRWMSQVPGIIQKFWIMRNMNVLRNVPAERVKALLISLRHNPRLTRKERFEAGSARAL
jgi:hypothetical protein